MKRFFDSLGLAWLASILLFAVFAAGKLAGDGLADVPMWLIRGSLFCVIVSFLIGDRQDLLLRLLCSGPLVGVISGIGLGMGQMVAPASDGTIDILSFARELMTMVTYIFFCTPLLAIVIAFLQRMVKYKAGKN